MKQLKVLIACEESQTVCKAFRKLGHEAYSCDILECSGGHPEWHIKGDVLKIINEDWDLIIAHPPCTYLSNAGIKWFNEDVYGEKAKQRKILRQEALDFFLAIANAKCKYIAIENPVGYVNSQWRKPNQTFHPYHFGDPDSKRTCLWLKNLPNLEYTNVVEPKIYGYYKKGKKIGMPIYFHDSKTPSEDRSKVRSKTFDGIANAMADQWSNFIIRES